MLGFIAEQQGAAGGSTWECFWVKAAQEGVEEGGPHSARWQEAPVGQLLRGKGPGQQASPSVCPTATS